MKGTDEVKAVNMLIFLGLLGIIGKDRFYSDSVPNWVKARLSGHIGIDEKRNYVWKRRG